jgi:hypothetical protein
MPAANKMRTSLPARLFTVKSVDFANVANSATLAPDQTVTVKGLVKGAPLVVVMPSLEADLTFCNAHCSAADTLKVRFRNTSGAGINPVAQNIHIIQF